MCVTSVSRNVSVLSTPSSSDGSSVWPPIAAAMCWSIDGPPADPSRKWFARPAPAGPLTSPVAVNMCVIPWSCTLAIGPNLNCDDSKFMPRNTTMSLLERLERRQDRRQREFGVRRHERLRRAPVLGDGAARAEEDAEPLGRGDRGAGAQAARAHQLQPRQRDADAQRALQQRASRQRPRRAALGLAAALFSLMVLLRAGRLR